MPRRREYLALVGTALAPGIAGCGRTASGGARTTTSTSTASPSTTFRYTTAAGGDLTVEPGPVDAPDLAWTVEKGADATAEHPCRIRVTLENTGPARELTAAGELPFPPTPGRRADGDEGARRPVLVPVDDDRDRRFGGDCWQAPIDDPAVADDAPWDWGHGSDRTRTVEPGEQFQGSYDVLADWTQYCFQRGDYRFRRRYELDGEAHEWAFTLHVPSYDRDR